MKTSSIVNLLRVFAIFCLIAGGIATLIFIFYCFENASAGIPMVIMSLFVAIFGSITYSAMAIIIEAVDSIAQTNKKIAEHLENQDNPTVKTVKDYDNSLPPM